MHGVVRTARSEVRGLRRREHVVGRRDHVVERDVVAVADASEGGDVGHRSPVCGGRGDERRSRVHACGKYSGVPREHRLPDCPARHRGAGNAYSLADDHRHADDDAAEEVDRVPVVHADAAV